MKLWKFSLLVFLFTLFLCAVTAAINKFFLDGMLTSNTILCLGSFFGASIPFLYYQKSKGKLASQKHGFIFFALLMAVGFVVFLLQRSELYQFLFIISIGLAAGLMTFFRWKQGAFTEH